MMPLDWQTKVDSGSTYRNITQSVNGITGCHPESYWMNFLLTSTFCKHRPVRNIRQPVIPLTDCVIYILVSIHTPRAVVESHWQLVSY